MEAHYNRANGYEHDAVVIYGDTDSVMIKFGTSDLAEAMRLGLEAAERVNGCLPPRSPRDSRYCGTTPHTGVCNDGKHDWE